MTERDAIPPLSAPVKPRPTSHSHLHSFLPSTQAEVKQQQQNPTIRSYLKLYTTIGLPKLAALAEADEPTFREHLQCIKHKSHQLTHAATGGAALTGTWQSAADVDFYVEGEVAHVAGQSTIRKHSDYFVKQINKLEEIYRALK
jgi:translation initiation factor 3 subunit L